MKKILLLLYFIDSRRRKNTAYILWKQLRLNAQYSRIVEYRKWHTVFTTVRAKKWTEKAMLAGGKKVYCRELAPARGSRKKVGKEKKEKKKN